VEFSKKQTKSETLSETRDADFVWSGLVRSGRARLMEFGHYAAILRTKLRQDSDKQPVVRPRN